MGYKDYSISSRTVRAASAGYATASADEIFKQNRKRMIHESMVPSKALLRESRDSDKHPNSLPIIFALDLTGSMGHIPHYLVQEGIVKIMSGIMQSGVTDPQILFLGVGDHECDKYPLQVGQFETGDEELDMWLTRTYIEHGGGVNEGESYSLAWYFAANHTITDSWEKRKHKGLLFTIGDEPCLRTIPAKVIKEIMGVDSQSSFKDEELLKKAQETYDVYHLHMMEGSAGHRSLGYWEALLGQNCIKVNDKTQVSEILIDIVKRHAGTPNLLVDSVKSEPKTDSSKPVEIIL